MTLSLREKGEVFVGVGIEFFEAHLAAEFHFLVLVNDALHLIPLVEGLIGDEADLEWIRFYGLFGSRSARLRCRWGCFSDDWG